MLLRSSSTPVSQSIFVESPKHDHFDNTSDHYIGKISFHASNHLCSFSCNSSSDQFNPKKPNNLGRKSPRRAQSDGNLKGLVSKSDLDEVYRSKVLPRSCHNQENIMLQTEPSFSIYNDQDFEEEKNGKLVRSVTIGNDIADMIISDEFSFGKRLIGLIKEEDDDNEESDEKEDKEGILDGFEYMGIEEGSEPVSPMYLAAGFGIDVNVMENAGVVTPVTEGGLMRTGCDADGVPSKFDENGDVEEYFKILL